ncbi:PTS fructose transporter subunit IIABC [Mycoplasma todarodis]|uniref:PTS fructose transporter subunit IIABC n=1 Tax=Mycoplasma todarodis TaxID=1937191 RepID=UPI003B3540AF
MKQIISEELIVSSKSINSKKDLFKLIANTMKKNKLTTDVEGLTKDLEERESLGSTAFENGLMIPHCRTKHINETKLVIVKFNDNNFDSIDSKETNFAVAILVPEIAEKEHLVILSKLSRVFSTKEKLEQFKKNTKKEKVAVVTSAINEEEVQDKKVDKYDFVAVTSCAAGIAHTYMARDGLVDGAKKLGLNAKVETRGATTENRLTAKEIEDAEFVIIAADVSISKKRFAGKKILVVDTNAAIRDGVDVIERAKDAEVSYGKAEKVGKLRIGGTDKKKQKLLGKAVMSALSFMIPIAIAGGILMAIPNAAAAGGNSSGGTWHFPNKFSNALWDFGHIGLILMVPILAMFLAYKIGGKAAMPAALIGGFFINDGQLMGKYTLISLPQGIGGSASAGFLGGLVVGIGVGYLVRMMQWIKWHRWIKPVSNLMIIPILTSFITFLIVTYVIGSPMTWVMAELYIGLSKVNSAGLGVSILIGILFAALMAIDLGGPINKTTLTVATVIFMDTLAKGDPNFTPQTAVQAAIAVPPLGMWLSTIIFRRKFSQTEVAAGQAALPMGLVGITEGALPFAFKTPLKAIFANVMGSMVAGALVTLFQIKFYGGLGSPLGAYIGYSEHSFFGLAWIFSILCGVIVTGVIYGLIRKKVPAYEEEHKQNKIAKKAFYAEQGLTTKKAIFNYNVKNIGKKSAEGFKHCINPKNWFERPED